VWDTGPGLPEGDPGRLFTPWYTTKDRGTGLGLAIAQRITRAHGWTIEPSRSDGITRFEIAMPEADVIHPREPEPEAKVGRKAAPRRPEGECAP
jgi:signal transduction histidine kinase